MTKAWRRVGRRLDGRRVEGLLRGGPSPRRCPSHNLLCFSVSLPPPTPYKSKSVLVLGANLNQIARVLNRRDDAPIPAGLDAVIAELGRRLEEQK